MGLDKYKKTPCGFCFVEFEERSAALKSIQYLNRTYLDGRDIQIDIDGGFQEGRQFGRGATGGQLGDERRRERDSGGGYAGRGGANLGSGAMLTRSITIIACITMISVMLISQQADSVELASDFKIIPFGGLLGGGSSPFLTPYMNRYDGKGGRYVSVTRVRQAQITKQRKQFEIDLAQFLVNLMKSAKPTLLKAFIKATLADKQLKETAIGLFFGSGDEDGEESEEHKDGDKDKEKDEDDESSKDDKDKDKKKRGKDKDKE